MIDANKNKSLVFVFILMFWGSFANFVIVSHYLWLEYRFNEIMFLSVFTAIGTTVFFYWWRSKYGSEENNVPPKGMPKP